MFKMPERKPEDGPIEITQDGDTHVLAVVHEGERRAIRMSDYNAARALALLAFRLGIKLPPDVRIKL